MNSGETAQSKAEAALSGKRIVVTRARSQAAELTSRLAALGADVVEFPTIAIVPARDLSPLDQAIARLEEYQWLFFTSINGVECFFARMRQLRRTPAIIEHLKVVAIGPETARHLKMQGIRPYLVPEKYQAEGILEDLTAQEIRGSRILIPRAAKARDILPETLRRWGAAVDVVAAYATVLPSNEKAGFRLLLQKSHIDMLTFTSSSTVANFVRLFAEDNLRTLLAGVKIACIGPITAQTAADHGLHVDVIAAEFTIPGLVRAIETIYQPAKSVGAAK